MTMSVSDNETQDLLKTICDKLDILIKMNKPITVKADLTDEDLRNMMKDPKYWRDNDPEIVRKIEQGFKELYQKD